MTDNNSSNNANKYLEDNRILPLFEDMLQFLIVNKPADPIESLITFLRNPHGPKIIVVGPPHSGRSSAAKFIAEKYGVALLNLNNLAEKSQAQNGLTVDLNSLEACISLIAKNVHTEEYEKSGWVLDGFPNTRNQALALQTAGVLADKIILLETEDNKLRERNQLSPSDSFEENLLEYHRNIKGIYECYKSNSKKIDASLTFEFVQSSLRSFLDSKSSK